MYMKYDIKHTNNTQIQYKTVSLKNTSCQITSEK